MRARYNSVQHIVQIVHIVDNDMITNLTVVRLADLIQI